MKTNIGEGVSVEPTSETYYHGTKASLNYGDLIEPGYHSNYGKREKASFVYLTATLDAAVWGRNLPRVKEMEKYMLLNLWALLKMIQT